MKKPPSVPGGFKAEQTRKGLLARQSRRPLDLWPRINFIHDRDRLFEVVTHRDCAIEKRGRVLLEIVLIRAKGLKTVGDIKRLGPCVGAFLFKVEPGLQRAVQAEDSEPALARDGLMNAAGSEVS